MTSDDKTAVLAVNEAFYRAFEKKDIQSLSQLWWQGSGSSCIHPGGKMLKGWEKIENSWRAIFQNTSYLEIDTEIMTTEVGNDVAYVVLLETVLQSSRRQTVKAQSIATNGFVKMAQKWYLVHHHGSPIMVKH